MIEGKNNHYDIDTLISTIRRTPHCRVLDPEGLPRIRKNESMPDDLRRFYTRCGGIYLFEDQSYALTIVPPTRCIPANPVMVGELFEDDISSTWYIIADDGNSDYLTIDLSPQRLGRCYNSFEDVHGVAGSCPIIAPSFTDLLTRLYENQGQYWYWLRPDFVALGDAYDDIM